MANGNDGASVLIDVGVDIGSSYTSFSEGIKTLIEEINKNPPKIRVELDLSHIKSSSIRSQLKQELSGKGLGSGLTSTIDASTLTKTAEGAKNASDEILRLKNETKSLNTTLNTASKRLNSFDAQLTRVRNPKTGESSISDTTKQLIDLQNKIKEINTTTKGITTQYFGLKTALGGEGATGDNAVYVEQLKNKYLELMNAVELVRVKNATASAEEIQQVYTLQGEMDTLIAQIRERIAVDQQSMIAKAQAEEESASSTQMEVDVEARKQTVLTSVLGLLKQVTSAEEKWTAAKNDAKTSSDYAKIQSIAEVLREYVQELLKGNVQNEEFQRRIEDINSALGTLRNNFKLSEDGIRANGNATKTFSERVGSLAEKFGYWFSITRVIMAVYRAMRQMVSASIALDDAMTQLQIVTKDTEETYERFGDQIADTAKKIGSSISDLLDSTTVYARLGYSLDESSMLAEYTAMLQNVGNIDVSDAQDAITAIVKAFDVNVDEIESVMDKLVTTGNNFPISVAQIAEGMNNASSALAAAGNTFEQSVALLTAANTTIQNAAKSSTGLRTIAARIRNTKTELDELGEEMLSEAQYEELVKQLTDFNVALTTVNGEYRSTYDIMYDIAQQWSKMTSMEQAALATAMSGTRQQAIFYSIIEQFQEATGAMDAMADSAGELQKSYDIYMDSTTAHINQFKAAFQELGADTFDSDFLKQFIDLGTSALEWLDSLMQLIDYIGGLNTVLYTTVGLIATIKGAAVIGMLKKLLAPIISLTNLISALNGKEVRATTSGQGLGKTFGIMAGKANTFTFSINAAQIAVGAFVAIIGVALLAYSKWKKSLEEIADKAEETAQRTKDSAKKLIELKTQLENGTTSAEELTEAFKEQLKQMGYTNDEIGELIDKYHGLAGAIDEVTETEAKRALAAAKASERAQFKSDRGIFGYNFDQAVYGGHGGANVASAEVAAWPGFNAPEEWRKQATELSKLLSVINSSTGEGLLDYYNKLLEIQSKLNDEALYDDSIYTSGYYKKISAAISQISDKFGEYLEAAEDTVQTTKLYNDIMRDIPEANAEAAMSIEETLNKIEEAAVETKKAFADLFTNSEGEKSEFSESMNSYIDDVEKLQTALQKIRSGDGITPTEQWELIDQFPELAVEAENLESALVGVIGKLKESAKIKFDSAISALTDDEEIDKANEAWKIFEHIADASKKAAPYAERVNKVLSDFDKAIDIAAKANEEMAKNGEISSETVQSLVELVGEEGNWARYVELSNGKLQLKTALLKEQSKINLSNLIQAAEEELEVLQNQNKELKTNIALYSTKRLLETSTIGKTPSEILAEGSGPRKSSLKGTRLGAESPMEIMARSLGINIDEQKAKNEAKLQAGLTAEEIQKQYIEFLKSLEANLDTKFDASVADAINNAIEKSTDGEQESLQSFNWIDTIIDRIQRKINKFGRVVSSTFKSLSTRNTASKKEIEAITEEIELQERAYLKYIELCESVNLSNEIKKTIQSGAIDISEYDEETAELISQYQEWYEAALDTKDAVDELHESLASLYDDEFNRIQTDFENRISLLEYLTNMYNTGISQLEAEGYMASTEFYKALTESTEHNIDLLKEELSGLEAALQAALDSGEIEMYSEAWYGYITMMNGVKEAIADANLSLAEFARTMQEIDWEYFDYLQERISNITDESEFLLDLLGEDNIFKDGKLTAEGMSVLGLRAMDYNVYMAQADKYAQEIAEIEQQLANDPNNKTLLDRREELLELQRESILAAEDEKDTILDLVQTAIEEELDSLKELIEAYKDALDAAKSLYDYRNKITDETSEISSLQKQIFAYSGDNSEEARATIQQLKDQLVKAQKELEETEYDKYISDQKKLLDNLYAEYELLLNQRMDNTDALLADIIAMVNQNASTISDTLHMTADSVGYTLSDSMQTVWNTSFSSLQSVVTMYGEGFLSQLTTTNQTINNIAALVSNMKSYSNSWANGYIGGVNNSYIPDYSGWTPGGYDGNIGTGYGDWESETIGEGSYGSTAPTPVKPITIGGRINAAGATIYRRSDRSDGGTTQYFGNDPIYTVLSQQQNKYGETMLLVRHHSQSSGNTGWFRMSDVRAYKHGGLVDQTGLVWLDGTKQKPETVLNAEDTKRFQSLVESMDKFASKGFKMKNFGMLPSIVGSMLDGGRAEITPVRPPHLPMSQNVAITIPIDHVYDYNDFLNQLRSDKNGKRIIQALALDNITGKNSLRVNKYNI